MYTTVFGNVGYCLMKLFGLVPIKKNKIVFQSFYGAYESDNPKCIYDAMRKKYSDYDFVWLMQDKNVKIEGCRVVKSTSINALYELATAKCWIDNSRKREWCVKRKEQYYVQTWHAGIGLKAGEKACEDTLSKKYVDSAINDSKMADLFLANSDWQENLYREYFWYDGKILKKGLPREDLLYRNTGNLHEKICSFYNVPTETHFILYAPTFRANGSMEPYDMNYKNVISALSEETGCKWKIILRLHPNISNEDRTIEFDEDILNGTQYSEINDLILASDFLITDYSSCMFDGMIAGKKVLIYASDIADYAKERGYLFDLENLPFSVSTTTKELIDNIGSFNEKEYTNRVDIFRNSLGLVPGGNASEDVADFLIAKMK